METLNTQSILATSPWEVELSEVNRRGARVAIWLVLILYPLFGLLDYLIAPAQSLPYLFSGRAMVIIISLIMLRSLNNVRLMENIEVISALYMFLVGAGITFMICFMGGLSSPYYAGLNLVMLGCGLLFVWPPNICILTHGATFTLWLLPNLIFVEVSEPLAAVSNGLFLFATAFIVSAGQIFNHQRLYQQHSTQSDLSVTQHNLYRAHKKLQQLDSFKSRFFANITHELKTPLALILSSTELLLRDEFGSISTSQRSPVEHMQRHGVKLLKLINDLLDLTKIEESRLNLRVANSDISSWASGLIKEIKPLAERKGVEVSFESRLSESFLYFDAERMERVLVNLLSNATKFTDSGGGIKISVWGDDHRVQLSVADTGRGFTPEQGEKIFDRFYQTDMGSNRKYGGTGIGLALSQELVELHGGQIFATGEEGVGATFTISLLRGVHHFDQERVTVSEAGDPRSTDQWSEPVSDDITEVVNLSAESELRFVELENASERRVVERDPDENQRKATVLIAEDNPDITRLLHLGLRRHFKVVTADNGKKALELMSRFSPSLVITDLMMPEMDGSELTQRIKTHQDYAHVPVLMLSARDGIAEDMAEAGFSADAYMAKPFSTRELCKVAKRMALK